MTTRSAGSASTRRTTAPTRNRGGRGPLLQTHEYTHHAMICRAQPVHNGHLDVIAQGFQMGAKKMTILIGSASTPRNPRNPLMFPERRIIMERALETAKSPDVRAAFKDGAITILPLSDRTYDNEGWVVSVQEQIRTSLLMSSDSQKTKTAILGYSKDPSTSFYLKMFGAAYGQANARAYATDGSVLDATTIRKILFSSDDAKALLQAFQKFHMWMPESVLVDLRAFMLNKEEYLCGLSPWKYLKTEYDAIERMKAKWVPPRLTQDQLDAGQKQWELPYGVQFNTADPILIQSGHIAMVQRNIWPGKGLWAIPGGHLESGESLLQCALRELMEEVNIELPLSVIMGSLKGSQRFDDVHRSLRGRYITEAFLFHLNPRAELPILRGDGQKETAKAEWIPLSEILEEECFEDHFFIIERMKAMMSKDYPV